MLLGFQSEFHSHAKEELFLLHKIPFQLGELKYPFK